MKDFLRHLLFVNQDTDKVSHKKLWSNIGYAIMCYLFVYAVMYGSEVEHIYWAVFATAVIGNNTLGEIFRKK